MPAVLLQLSRRTMVFVAFESALIVTALAIAARSLWFPATLMTDGVFVTTGVLVVSAVMGWRVAFEWLMQRIGPRERLLLIGATDASAALARELSSRRLQLGIEVVGIVDSDAARVGHRLFDTRIIGTIDDIAGIVRRRRVDRVVVNLADARGRLPMDTLLDLRLRGISVDHLASVYEQYTGKIALENLRPSWFIFSPGFRHTRAMTAAKRLLDIAVGVTGLVVTAPLMVLVAAAVKLTSNGPVLYSQRRVGQNGRIFIIRKFRSMRVDAEAQTGAVWATAHDSRLTPIGRWLRSTRLDELPQLWNVLIDDMSLVGPRPERPEFVGDLERQIKFYAQRHLVKPGLTGWAQISYRYGSTVEDALQKLQYDLYYLKHMSVALDVFILFATLKTVLSRTGY